MAFTPGRTLTLDVGEEPVTAPLPPNDPQVAVLNIGPGLAFVAFGVGPVEADPEAGLPLPVNVPLILTKGVGADVVEAVVIPRFSDGQATYAVVFVTPGSGA